MTTTELEFKLTKVDGTTDIHRCPVFSYNYRIPVEDNGDFISLDFNMYEPIPDFLLRFAKEQGQSADITIRTDLPGRNGISFHNVRIINQIYESGNFYPGSGQVNSNFSMSAESCIINGVEFGS